MDTEEKMQKYMETSMIAEFKFKLLNYSTTTTIVTEMTSGYQWGYFVIISSTIAKYIIFIEMILKFLDEWQYYTETKSLGLKTSASVFFA